MIRPPPISPRSDPLFPYPTLFRSRPEPRGLAVRTYLDEAVPEIRLTVADNGPGIPAELRARVFEPFFTTKKPGVGTGLGLSMSLGHVRAHGGDIEKIGRAHVNSSH